MNALKQANDDYIVSYLLLRQIIGILGLLLPFSLIFGNHWLGNESWLQPSISHYFYSYMHFAFVGVLFILGAVLITYREKEYRLANRVSTLAGIFSFLVAIFPTEFKGFNDNAYLITSDWEKWFKWIHFGSAFFLFSCFAVFCFIIFQKSDKDVTPSKFDKKKKLRNRIYTLCGWGIVISIVMIGACTLYEVNVGVNKFTEYSTFLFETTALLCFGNSWLLKGSVNWKNDDSELLRKVVSPVR
jgi:heme A synthase